MLLFKRTPTENFEVHKPLTIFEQDRADKCTSCSLSAIAEDILEEPIDDSYLFDLAKIDGQFGIKPSHALETLFQYGVKTKSGTICKPFSKAVPIDSWFQFETVRKTMFYNKRSLWIGIHWQPEWTFVKDGILFEVPDWKTYLPHAMKIFGQVEINGIMYIKAQDSRGLKSGDQGIWYLPKEVIEKLPFVYELI